MEFSTLEIRILLKCAEKAISKRDVTQLYSNYPKAERDTTILKLIDQGYITAQVMPKPGTRKPPTFYRITDKGQQWVDKYLESYPG